MKKVLALTCLLFALQGMQAQKTVTISKAALKDKIKGGWAGQTIGVTFGGPYEFRFQGTFIGDYQPLTWNDSLVKKNMIDNAGLYDDLYMDLTFVDVFEKYGLKAPVILLQMRLRIDRAHHLRAAGAGLPLTVASPEHLKAVILNLLSVGAAFGVMVLMWQNGYGSEAIWGIKSTGAITS